ncbi:hypothetical protein CRYUN_Cryun01aG0248000 [Craigia yunnanensis]
MALSPCSHHRAGKQLFLYQSPLRSVLLFFSSSRIKTHGEGTDEQKRGWGDKAKSSIKTKSAKSMARVINSTPWSSELESSISSLSPSLSTTTVLQTLRLIKTPSKALQFFNWVQNMGFPYNAQSFFLMLEILGKERNLNAARNLLPSIEKRSNGSVKLEDKFFNSLIMSYVKAGLFQVSIKVFETMKSIGVSPSVVSFNNLLSILLKRGRTNMLWIIAQVASLHNLHQESQKEERRRKRKDEKKKRRKENRKRENCVFFFHKIPKFTNVPFYSELH